MVTGGGAPPGSSDGDASEADERQLRTLGPVTTTVARGAVGFGSGGGVLEGAWRRRILEAHALEWRLLASHLWRRRRPSLGASDDDELP
jgi:hypothetical protein